MQGFLITLCIMFVMILALPFLVFGWKFVGEPLFIKYADWCMKVMDKVTGCRP